MANDVFKIALVTGSRASVDSGNFTPTQEFQRKPAAHRLLTVICAGPVMAHQTMPSPGVTMSGVGAGTPTREGSVRKKARTFYSYIGLVNCTRFAKDFKPHRGTYVLDFHWSLIPALCRPITRCRS